MSFYHRFGFLQKFHLAPRLIQGFDFIIVHLMRRRSDLSVPVTNGDQQGFNGKLQQLLQLLNVLYPHVRGQRDQ